MPKRCRVVDAAASSILLAAAATKGRSCARGGLRARWLVPKRAVAWLTRPRARFSLPLLRQREDLAREDNGQKS